MAKNENQKLKLYRLIQIMLQKTDDNHRITMPEIRNALEAYGITAERKSIYADFASMEELGIEVIGEQFGRQYYYHVASRQFELAELKLLVDAIQSSRFITEKKSSALIKKLESLASEHEAKQLQRQVYVAGRIKTMNESIYYNIDAVHAAIGMNQQIQFQYFQWNVRKEMELRKDGAFYQVSPWALCWDNENYYMIAYDARAEKIKHYRVDKMVKISAVNQKREGKDVFRDADLAHYTQKYYGMYEGNLETVRIECQNELANVMIDRFGKAVMMIPVDEEHFIVHVNVAVTRLFLGWIFALGDSARIVGPEHVTKQISEEIRALSERYNGLV